jgi:hypothetical protein
MADQNATVLHLLPRVPPAVCGVADYTWTLARQLRESEGLESRFLIARPETSPPSPTAKREFPVSTLPSRTASALLTALQQQAPAPDCVVLQLSTYGFQKRGTPLWLAFAWARLSRLPHRPRLLTMFHELAASGPVTSSAFWLRPLQQHVLRRIARASDAVRTNREGFAAWLESQAGLAQGSVVTLPVFSNFGAPASPPAWDEREPAMVMFGWGIPAGPALASTVTQGAFLARRLGLSHLHVIGGRVPAVSTPDVQLTAHGFLSADAISRLLISCRAAYSAYNPGYYGKSTQLAAFASHGLLVVGQGRTRQLPDGLRDSVHLLNESTLEQHPAPLTTDWNPVIHALQRWYAAHSLAENAASYAAQIRALLPAPGA